MFKILAPNDPALSVLQEVLLERRELDMSLATIEWPKYRETLIKTLQKDSSPYHAVFVPGHIWIPELAEAGYLSDIGGCTRDHKNYIRYKRYHRFYSRRIKIQKQTISNTIFLRWPYFVL